MLMVEVVLPETLFTGLPGPGLLYAFFVEIGHRPRGCCLYQSAALGNSVAIGGAYNLVRDFARRGVMLAHSTLPIYATTVRGQTDGGRAFSLPA